jgi:membrane protease YdiL (CAAX protease family)
MSQQVSVRSRGPAFWTVMFVLLRAANIRAFGRYRRLRRLRRQRLGGSAISWRPLGFALVCVIATFPHIGAALDISLAVPVAEKAQAEANGRVVVEDWFLARTAYHEMQATRTPAKRDEMTREENSDIDIEADRLAQQYDDDKTAIEARLRTTVRQNLKALLSSKTLWWQPGALPDIVVLIAVLWWSLMLICQGEGPELEAQRTYDPMWEWLFSHPASPAAIFLAEMLSPIAANPMYVAAPLFSGLVYGMIYGWGHGVAATFLVGVPVVVALACVGKSIQIWATLQLSPRARGAVLGLMSWFGFISVFPILLIATYLRTIIARASDWLTPVAGLPWPPVRMLAGRTALGSYDFWTGIALCASLAAILILLSVAFAVMSTRRGIVGRSVSHPASIRIRKPMQFGREPLYLKELLWLRRDGSALVQAILMPLSLGALQVANLHGLIAQAANDWSTPCGVAVLFGTYFLLTLGPKSLASEGRALWIALTWPRGLEALLKVKARLWVAIASIFVGIALVYAAWRYPADIPQILIVGLLWWVFGRSLAEKTVTLTTTVSPSGEPEKIPTGLRWAAVLGTLSFAVGIFTQRFSLAIAGVVYSIVTAAAMWQNFRYRLPYLWDPWSQRSPPPPTLLHAMVAISAMIEGVALLSAIALAVVGRDNVVPINAALYGICAIVTAAAVSRFLATRGVRQRDIWVWRADDADQRSATDRPIMSRSRLVLTMVLGAALGTALGAAAHVYVDALHWVPEWAQTLDEGRRRLDELPNARAAYVVMAVAFAPLAEEFLFRGLLYRALDREWGGWRAIVGAAAFFAVYHPALSWAPVMVLGAINAILFKRTGLLAPAVAAHAAYNAVVLAF